MGERSVAQARASVMIYNNDSKKWEHAGGTAGISRVHVYFNPNNSSYRIVGRKANDNEVVINCIIAKNLKYNKATATFHQWRDQRQVYGLNFQAPDDAVCFSEAVLGAVEDLTNPPPVDVPAAPQYNGNDVGSQYKQFQENPYKQPSTQVNEPQKSPQPTYAPTVRAPDPPKSSPPSVPQVQPAPPVVVTSVPPSTPAPPPVPPVGPPMPPPGPPMPPGGGGPPPPPPPPPVGGSGPPAPPPPPSAANSGGGGGIGGAGGLANALAGIQLKKRSESDDRRPPPAQVNPMDDMMSALNKKLLARKKMSESPGENDRPTPSVNKTVVPPPASKAAEPTFKKSNFGGTLNKKTNEMQRANSTSVNSTSSLSADELKSLKEEIMSCVKEEIQTAKNEIIQALRQELSRLSSS